MHSRSDLRFRREQFYTMADSQNPPCLLWWTAGTAGATTATGTTRSAKSAATSKTTTATTTATTAWRTGDELRDRRFAQFIRGRLDLGKCCRSLHGPSLTSLGESIVRRKNLGLVLWCGIGCHNEIRRSRVDGRRLGGEFHIDTVDAGCLCFGQGRAESAATTATKSTTRSAGSSRGTAAPPWAIRGLG